MNDRIAIVLEGYKVLAGLSDPDPFKIQELIEARIRGLEAELDRLRGNS